MKVDIRFYFCRSDDYCMKDSNFVCDFEYAYNGYMGIAFNCIVKPSMYMALFVRNKLVHSSITILNYDTVKKFKHLFGVD